MTTTVDTSATDAAEADAELDPRDAELIARAEPSGDEPIVVETNAAAPSPAAPEPASEEDASGAVAEATDPAGGAPPATAAVPAALRKAVKIVLRLAQANEHGERAAHVFVRVDGADPVCAVRVPPCADALRLALQGVEAAVARALADPPKAPAATRAAPAAARVAKSTTPPADAPRVCVVCKGSYAKGRYKAHAQEPGHKTAELAAAAQSAPAPSRIVPPASTPAGAPPPAEPSAPTPARPAPEPTEGPGTTESAPSTPAPPERQAPARPDARPVQVSLF